MDRVRVGRVHRAVRRTPLNTLLALHSRSWDTPGLGAAILGACLYAQLLEVSSALKGAVLRVPWKV